MSEQTKTELGIPKNERPDCKMVGEDGNMNHCMGRAANALKKAGFSREKIEEMYKEVTSLPYPESFQKIGEYVNFT